MKKTAWDYALEFIIVATDIDNANDLLGKTDDINERNILVKRGLSSDYYIDKEIINKVNLLFEKPSKSEVDIWINNNRK